MKPHQKLRWQLAGILLVVIPIGFFTKLYRGPVQLWVNHSLGGVLYEIFWCLVVAWGWPKARPFLVALWIFLMTCCLEFLQLWHPLFLETIRNTCIGQVLLGTTFTWWDLPHYLIGSVIGGWIIFWLQKSCLSMISDINQNP